MKHYHSPPAGIAGILLTLSFLQPADAAVLSWGLRFFDGNGYAGRGKFSYDTSTRDFIKYEPFSVDPDGFYVNSLLTGFSANILGQDWKLNGLAWWADDNNAPGHQVFHRLGTDILDRWVSSDTFGFRQLALSDFTEDEPGRQWSGGWYMAIASDPVPSSGSWIATPVPVPAALPLFASALAALGLVSWHRQVSRPNLI